MIFFFSFTEVKEKVYHPLITTRNSSSSCEFWRRTKRSSEIDGGNMEDKRGEEEPEQSRETQETLTLVQTLQELSRSVQGMEEKTAQEEHSDTSAATERECR